MNRQSPRMIALPKHLQDLVVDLSNSDFKLLAGAMHGASISGGCKKEKQLFKRLKYYMPDLEDLNYNEKTGNEWDFRSKEYEMYIDSKSPGYNGNIPAKNVAIKYIQSNPENYEMFFVMSDNDTGKWPISKYKAEGISVITEKEFMEILNGKKK